MYEFLKGDALMVRVVAHTTTRVDVIFAVEFDDGSTDMIPLSITHAGDGGVELHFVDESFTSSGKLVGLTGDVAGTIGEGTFFMTAFIRRTEANIYPIGSFNVTTHFFGGLGLFEPQALALWVYQSDITNGAGGGGNVSVTAVPGAGNEMEILMAEILNGDTTTRTLAGRTRDDAANQLRGLFSVATATGGRQAWPHGRTDQIGGPGRVILAGDMDLFLISESVAASENASFSIVARIRGGGLPTVTEVGNATPTITINTEKVFG